ncbi:hypothetical protein [Arenibaculum pallidiluteum]|uniref:hypothetical protein n=1 Tax=Arenibaculum pallidiluteum TaxID=2812559 RepID=UPI001A96D41B|nr:hypothetical protein [Arenibaculum pallidiluteum]
MTDDPIELDARRGLAGRKATETRREERAVAADQAAIRQRQDELEAALMAEPAANWPDLAAKASYLIGLFADTPEGRDPRHAQLIRSALDDIRRLSGPEPAQRPVQQPTPGAPAGDTDGSAGPRPDGEA